MQMMQMLAPSLALGDGNGEDEVVDRENAGTVSRTLSCWCCCKARGFTCLVGLVFGPRPLAARWGAFRRSLDVPLEAPGVLRATRIDPCSGAERGVFKLRWDEDAACSIWGAAGVGVTFMVDGADGAGLGNTSF